MSLNGYTLLGNSPLTTWRAFRLCSSMSKSDDPKTARAELFGQLNEMRKSVEEQLFDLCAAVQEVIKNQEREAITAAIEEGQVA